MITSPGSSQADRAGVEAALQPPFRATCSRFLLDVERAGLGAVEAPVLLAAVREPFTLHSVNSLWTNQALPALRQSIVDLEVTKINKQAVDAIMDRLRYSTLPEDAHEAVSVVLKEAATSKWSRPTIARRLKDAMSEATWQGRVRQIARTEATAIASHRQLLRIGDGEYPFKKWVSHHDDRVRATHAAADGQVVPVDQPFTVGLSALMFPGDPMGPVEETASCRCSMVGRRRP